ncbi:hypothetical protein HUS81_31000, partial [Pseudomonas chlororaphis]|nr:hypothetical protein [Pseudomonas chlororaphis]
MLERALMQRFDVKQRGFDAFEALGKHRFADADSRRTLSQKGFDFVTVPGHEVRFFRAE